MRRILTLLFAIVFAVASEGPALCALAQPAHSTGTHGCCGQQPVSTTSLQTCCAASQPDRDGPLPAAHLTTAPATCLAAQPLAAADIAATSTAHAAPRVFRSTSIPIYLQHSTLLI